LWDLQRRPFGDAISSAFPFELPALIGAPLFQFALADSVRVDRLLAIRFFRRFRNLVLSNGSSAQACNAAFHALDAVRWLIQCSA
jgi:hypothetical protein